MRARMGGSEGEEDAVERLIEALRTAADDRARVIAIVWKWLERRLKVGGILSRHGPRIRKAAAESREPVRIDDALLERIGDAPVKTAAELLARMHAELVRDAGGASVDLTRDIDGNEVFVVFRDTPLAALTRDPPPGVDHLPPTADEQPSLSTLAPRLGVYAAEYEGVELDVLTPEDELPDDTDEQKELRATEWRYAQNLLADSLIEQTSLDVHLDTLGEHGLTGMKIEDGMAAFLETEIDGDDERRCQEAAESAIREVVEKTSSCPCPTPAILLLPELAATANVREAIVEELRRHETPPALTVVGLYHLPAPELDEEAKRLVGDVEVAPWINEAVVLGPTGAELWRHRKLSSASLDGLQEAIQPGDRLLAIQTGIGTVAVVICLDVFKQEVRQRLIASPMDLLLVPSLSPTNHRHVDSLKELSQKTWGMGFVCNRSAEPRKEGETVWNEPHLRSFWGMQRHHIVHPPPRDDGDHPSFVFELSDYLPIDGEEEDS